MQSVIVHIFVASGVALMSAALLLDLGSRNSVVLAGGSLLSTQGIILVSAAVFAVIYTVFSIRRAMAADDDNLGDATSRRGVDTDTQRAPAAGTDTADGRQSPRKSPDPLPHTTDAASLLVDVAKRGETLAHSLKTAGDLLQILQDDASSVQPGTIAGLVLRVETLMENNNAWSRADWTLLQAAAVAEAIQWLDVENRKPTSVGSTTVVANLVRVLEAVSADGTPANKPPLKFSDASALLSILEKGDAAEVAVVVSSVLEHGVGVLDALVSKPSTRSPMSRRGKTTRH